MSYAYVVMGALSLGFAVYSSITAPGAPRASAPPPPSNAVQYDDNGEIISTQTLDPETNTWITKGRNSEPQRPAREWATRITGDYYKDKADPAISAEVEKRYQAHVAADPKGIDEHSHKWRYEEYLNMKAAAPDALEKYNADLGEYTTKYAEWEKEQAAAKVEKGKLDGIRSQMLDNLSATPEDRVAAYADYQKSFSDAAHAEVDPRFAKIERNTEENANATGMYGSRAYVDTKAELTNDKLKTDTDIANGAIMAKEQLAGNDRTYWANMLNQIDSGARSDSITTAQVTKNQADINNQNYAGVLARYGAENNNVWDKYKADQATSASYTSAGTNLAGGLLYLYGGKSGGKMGSGYVPSTNSGQIG